jgi:hypothetical protein
MQHHVARICVALGLSAALTASLRAQSTWYVDVNAAPPGDGSPGSPYSAIQLAIDAPTTLHDHTLLVAPGEYLENIELREKRLTLVGVAGPSATILRAAGPGAVARLDATGCTLEGFTVTGAWSSSDPGIRVPQQTQANAFIRRCVIWGNAGHGVVQNYDAQLENCTIANNGGQGVTMGGLARLIASNCVLWGNGTPTTTFTGFGTTVTYCALENEFCPGCGNFVLDPQFWNPLLGDYRLRAGSPCIDSGDPNVAGDPDGTRRDIGAYAFEATYTPAPQNYCTSKLNSLGCAPSVSWSGTPSAAGAPFTIHCTQVLNQRPGLYFYGYAPRFHPFQGGWLCVSSPTLRTPVTNSGGSAAPPDDCSGSHVFDFGARIQSGVDPALVAGQLVCGQFWYRDPASSFQSGRSNAVAFGIGP